MIIIEFRDSKGFHTFVSKDLEYARLCFESFMQDDDVTYMSLEFVEEK